MMMAEFGRGLEGPGGAAGADALGNGGGGLGADAGGGNGGGGGGGGEEGGGGPEAGAGPGAAGAAGSVPGLCPALTGFQKYAVVSVLLACATVYQAWVPRRTFYMTVSYLGSSRVCVAVMSNLLLCFAFCVALLLRTVLLGPLSDLETERLYERLKDAMMETCLAMTIFREEFDVRFVTLFSALLFVKSFHWIAGDRVDYMETRPNVPALERVRLLALMGLLAAVDVGMLGHAASNLAASGPSVLILFAFEYALLVTSLGRLFAKFGFFQYDLWRDGRWDGKGVATFYLELIKDLLHLVTYFGFFGVVFAYYGLPLHIVRELYGTFRSFRTRVNDFVRYRRVTRSVQQCFPDATAQELEDGDATCIFCRDEMVAGVAKKLQCGHIFHFTCLRSWLERHHTCPMCRATIEVSGGADAASAGARHVPRGRPPAEQPAPRAEARAGAPPPRADEPGSRQGGPSPRPLPQPRVNLRHLGAGTEDTGATSSAAQVSQGAEGLRQRRGGVPDIEALRRQQSEANEAAARAHGLPPSPHALHRAEGRGEGKGKERAADPASSTPQPPSTSAAGEQTPLSTREAVRRHWEERLARMSSPVASPSSSTTGGVGTADDSNPQEQEPPIRSGEGAARSPVVPTRRALDPGSSSQATAQHPGLPGPSPSVARREMAAQTPWNPMGPSAPPGAASPMLLHPFAPYGIFPPGSPLLHPAVLAGLQHPPLPGDASSDSGRGPGGGASPGLAPQWPMASASAGPSGVAATRVGMLGSETPLSSTTPRPSILPMMLPMPGAYAAYSPVLSSPMALPLSLPVPLLQGGAHAYVPGLPSPLLSPGPAEGSGPGSPGARALHEAQRRSVEHQMRILEAHMDILKLQEEVLRQRTNSAEGETPPSAEATTSRGTAASSPPATPPQTSPAPGSPSVLSPRPRGDV